MRILVFKLLVTLSLVAHPLFAAGWNWEEMDSELMEFPEEFLWRSNTAQISLDWSAIEPEEGVFHKIPLYTTLKPMITLHSFKHPQWFLDKGGFEKEENIEYFVRYCKHVFSQLGDRVHLWCTMHEPTTYVLMSYLLGLESPKKKEFALGATVLRNLLKAHCDVYRELKALPNGKDSAIGFNHKYLVFEPYHEWNPIEAIPCSIFTDNLNSSVMKFLREGSFEFYIPIANVMSYENLDAPKSFDFVALNYTSRGILSSRLSFTKELEVKPDAFYAESLYVAITECAHLGKPVYITETGSIGNPEKYLFAISEAISHGINIKGYFQ